MLHALIPQRVQPAPCVPAATAAHLLRQYEPHTQGQGRKRIGGGRNDSRGAAHSRRGRRARLVGADGCVV